jgi:hypothetical protein
MSAAPFDRYTYCSLMSYYVRFPAPGNDRRWVGEEIVRVAARAMGEGIFDEEIAGTALKVRVGLGGRGRRLQGSRARGFARGGAGEASAKEVSLPRSSAADAGAARRILLRQTRAGSLAGGGASEKKEKLLLSVSHGLARRRWGRCYPSPMGSLEEEGAAAVAALLRQKRAESRAGGGAPRPCAPPPMPVC